MSSKQIAVTEETNDMNTNHSLQSRDSSRHPHIETSKGNGHEHHTDTVRSNPSS
jgi:hypothetical protein